eukprot:3820748-Rhodomonas_salina.1
MSYATNHAPGSSRYQDAVLWVPERGDLARGFGVGGVTSADSNALRTSCLSNPDPPRPRPRPRHRRPLQETCSSSPWTLLLAAEP